MVNKAFVKETEELELEELAFEQIPMDSDVEENASEPEISEEEPVPEISEGKKTSTDSADVNV